MTDNVWVACAFKPTELPNNVRKFYDKTFLVVFHNGEATAMLITLALISA